MTTATRYASTAAEIDRYAAHAAAMGFGRTSEMFLTCRGAGDRT